MGEAWGLTKMEVLGMVLFVLGVLMAGAGAILVILGNPRYR